jgi:phosphate transport system substrate-binding protein
VRIRQHTRRHRRAPALLLTIIAVALTTASVAAHAVGATRQAHADMAGQPSGTVKEDGSGLLLPLVQAWAPAYHRQYPAATVLTGGGGSGVGINDAISGKVQVGTSDAYLSSGDVFIHPDLLNIPLVTSAQSVIYDLPSVPQSTHVHLSGAVLAQMYRGTITMWNDQRIAALNPNIPLPALPVRPLHRTIVAGDTFIFTQYLSTQDATWNETTGYGTRVAWPPNPADKSADGSTVINQTCARTPGCVSYNGVSYLTGGQALGLGEAALLNAEGNYTIPTRASIEATASEFAQITPADGTIALIAGPGLDSYPIVNFEYAIVKADQPTPAIASSVRDFLNWAITSGNAQSFTGPVGFAALPPGVQQVAAELIARIS